jgi:hypothetical protein
MKQTTIKRPIGFSGPMVRAILDGRKTQARFVIKPQPEAFWNDGRQPVNLPYDCEKTKVIRCPYGQPGDRLWVRETHAIKPNSGHVVAYLEGGECGAWCGDGAGGRFWIHHGHILEAPGYPFGLETLTTVGLRSFGGKWRPSNHMPRWASRITLEITAVRVERLNYISKVDAIAEGCQCAGVPASLSDVGAFAKLWESIKGKGSWKANPWVWVIQFEKVDK